MSLDIAYKNLSKFEKFKEIKEYNRSFCERNAIAKYLRALWLNDIEKINFFESFGDSPRLIISNYRKNQQKLLFGFKALKFDENGWIERPNFINIEEITVFIHKTGWKNNNEIQVGCGLNGKWTNGVNFTTQSSGHCNGISVWGKIFDTKEEAIEDACNSMIKWHTNKNCSYSNKVINAAKELIQKAKGNRPVQLCLF
jgi:hypothetical protein